MDPIFEQQSETKMAILLELKQRGAETISNLGSKLNISNEGVRLHLVQLERDGLVKRHKEKSASKGGRPALLFSLTSKGEAVFPKQYDVLTIEVIDTVINQLGMDAMKNILSTMVDSRVREWEWRIKGLSLVEKVAILKDLYTANDTYMKVDYQPESETIRLTEHNCPFYDVALQRPALCSVTLNTLTRLLGYRVVRDKSFQNGDGCCVFRVQTDKPIDPTTFSFVEEGV